MLNKEPLPAPTITAPPTVTSTTHRPQTDVSSHDMGICIGLLKKGRTDEQVAEHMLRHSPDLEVRKGKHVAEYVSRTIANARRIIGFA